MFNMFCYVICGRFICVVGVRVDWLRIDWFLIGCVFECFLDRVIIMIDNFGYELFGDIVYEIFDGY